MDFKDYYATLGLSKTASDKEIKQAFRKLARKYHPDVNPGDKAAEMRFKEINEANEVLGDPEKRKKYDELGANWRMYEQAQARGGQPGGPFSGQWTYSPGGGGFRPMTEDEVSEMFGSDDSPFSDFFRTFFGGGEPSSGRRTRPRPPRNRKGRDIEHELELDLESALHGSVQRLGIRHDGELDGVRILSPRSVALMRTNQVGTLHSEVGLGFGLGFETTDRFGANGLACVGSYGWSGAYGTTYSIDPESRLTIVMMQQVVPLTGDLRQKILSMVYQALIEKPSQRCLGAP